MGDCPHRGESCAVISGFEWERFAGIRGGDARFCIEKRFSLFAQFCRFKSDEPENGANLARSSHVLLKHAQDKSCGLAAVIQSRIERGQSAVGRGDVSRGTRDFGRLTPIVPLLVVILRSLRRRIFALHHTAAVIVGGFPQK